MSANSYARLFLLLCCAWHTHASPAPETVEILLPKHRLYPQELAVVVNELDPLSVQIGNYYRKARGIPEKNILHVRFKPGERQIPPREFRSIRQYVEQNTPAKVQAYAITWAAPYRVGCMSITSALTFGFNKDFCSKERCATTRISPYFNHRSTSPYNDLGIRPTMAIAATTFEEAKALIERGIQSDQSSPAGTAYLVSTSDFRRNVRAALYPAIKEIFRGWIETTIVESDALQNADDVLFYFTGKATVPFLNTLKFVPGAIADHLTSAGGKLTGSKQMSSLRWLEAGATGSYGTVVEPCNLPAKFPHPGLVMEIYGQGATLLEAYWKSVQQPGEGIFIGEPLAAPYDGYHLDILQDRILLHTRTLYPGRYRLMYSSTPIGPYKTVPGFLFVGHHQSSFTLPRLRTSYYRLQRVSTENADTSEP